MRRHLLGCVTKGFIIHTLAGGYHDFLAQDPQMSLGDIAMSIA